MKLTVYAYSKCGTCRKAIKWLTAQSHEITQIPIVDQPPTVEELAKLVENSGLELKKFFNTSGEVYRQLALKDRLPSMNHQEMLELLASNGKLIKRPIVTDGQQVTVGFKEEVFQDKWGES